MNCGTCTTCTYDEDMKYLCLPAKTREALLDIIYKSITTQFDTYEFLVEEKVNQNVKTWIADNVRQEMDCILPERK